jgi:hypothetical protein
VVEGDDADGVGHLGQARALAHLGREPESMATRAEGERRARAWAGGGAASRWEQLWSKDQNS